MKGGVDNILHATCLRRRAYEIDIEKRFVSSAGGLEGVLDIKTQN